MRQKHRSGCAIACAAMLTGLSYAAVLKTWITWCKGNPEELNAIGGGLRHFELLDLLAVLGKRIDEFSTPRIVAIKKKYGEHFVVITAKGRILDPA